MIVDDALMADLIAEANSLAGVEGLVLNVPDDLVLRVGTALICWLTCYDLLR
jgi:hypothetical protein